MCSKISLEARRRPAVGAERDGHAGIGEFFQIFRSDLQRLLVLLCALALLYRFLAFRVLELLDHIRVGLFQEERIIEEVRFALVDEGRGLSRQSRTEADFVRQQGVDQLLVDFLVAHAVHDEIDLLVEQSLGVIQVVEMRGHPDAFAMGVFDDRLVDVGPHFAAGSEVVVDADFDPVHFSWPRYRRSSW